MVSQASSLHVFRFRSIILSRVVCSDYLWRYLGDLLSRSISHILRQACRLCLIPACTQCGWEYEPARCIQLCPIWNLQSLSLARESPSYVRFSSGIFTESTLDTNQTERVFSRSVPSSSSATTSSQSLLHVFWYFISLAGLEGWDIPKE